LLLSMTGFGEARLQSPRWTIVVEVRTVNNRHFKLSAKISEAYAMIEPALEQLVREKVRRGTVQLNLRIERPRRQEDYRLNLVALNSYRDQLKGFNGFDGRSLDLSGLLALPGVVEDSRAEEKAPLEDWPEVGAVVSVALEKLEASRAQEGKAMALELAALGGAIRDHMSAITLRAPAAVQYLQGRLCERIQTLVRESGVSVEAKELARETAVLADRCDIAEELVRLRAHLTQFDEIIEEPQSAGRKLEFVTQEIGREINTIGSKANDVQISRSVVEVKALLEKIRELVQNVE
jgi:uncharacterized protein (TIGR00255 family)